MAKNNIPPRSKFERWVRRFGGTKKLATTLNVSRNAVQSWCAKKAQPGLKATFSIIKLADGYLTLRDLYFGTLNEN